jgi:hypothetical protein
MSMMRRKGAGRTIVAYRDHWRVLTDEDGSRLYYRAVIVRNADGELRSAWIAD